MNQICKVSLVFFIIFIININIYCNVENKSFDFNLISKELDTLLTKNYFDKNELYINIVSEDFCVNCQAVKLNLFYNKLKLEKSDSFMNNHFVNVILVSATNNSKSIQRLLKGKTLEILNRNQYSIPPSTIKILQNEIYLIHNNFIEPDFEVNKFQNVFKLNIIDTTFYSNYNTNLDFIQKFYFFDNAYYCFDQNKLDIFKIDMKHNLISKVLESEILDSVLILENDPLCEATNYMFPDKFIDSSNLWKETKDMMGVLNSFESFISINNKELKYNVTARAHFPRLYDPKLEGMNKYHKLVGFSEIIYESNYNELPQTTNSINKNMIFNSLFSISNISEIDTNKYLLFCKALEPFRSKKIKPLIDLIAICKLKDKKLEFIDTLVYDSTKFRIDDVNFIKVNKKVYLTNKKNNSIISLNFNNKSNLFQNHPISFNMNKFEMLFDIPVLDNYDNSICIVIRDSKANYFLYIYNFETLIETLVNLDSNIINEKESSLLCLIKYNDAVSYFIKNKNGKYFTLPFLKN
ncbi:MAG: hypothetical protein NTW25_02765 [Candidatus Kapabacteria bacterium]|nr:hypothetical protein [Candidatus Kapabacteria bacterium]